MNRDEYRMGLPLDLIEPIANRLLAEDVVDYISFRAVCRVWRSLTASPKSFASQFHPRHWIMLPNFGKKNPSAHVCFLNLLTGRSLVLNRFCELESHSVVSVCDGLLVLLSKENLTVRLFNPFTRHMSDDLPPLEPDQNFVFRVEMLSKYELTMKHCPIRIVAANSPTFMFYAPCGSIFFAKPGDARWQYKDYQFSQVMVNTFFKGTFYFINSDSIICANVPEQQMPVSSLVPLHYDARAFASVLVNFRSNLLLVCRIGELVPKYFELFQVDLESNVLVNVHSLGEYALFVGVNRQTVIVSSNTFPSIKANCIYCFFLYSDSTMNIHYSAVPSDAETAIYDLNDQSIELLSNFHDGDLLHPRTLADYLFKHCSLPQW